jgi:hypothetical protein
MYAKDLESTAAFCITCLDLKVVDGVAGEYRVFESDSWTISIVQVPPAVAVTSPY